MNNLEQLANGKIGRTLLRLSLPAVVAMAINGLNNVIDTFFIGKMGDTSAVGALSVLFPFFLVLTAIGSGIGVGAGSLIARLLGAKDVRQAERTASTALLLSVAAGLLLTVLGLFCTVPLLRLLGATDDVLPQAIVYTRWIVLSAVFILGDTVLSSAIRAEGNSVFPTVSLLIGTVCNIALDPVLIFLCGWGVAGAAIATSISYVISFAICLSYYLRRRSVLTLHVSLSSCSAQLAKKTMQLGIPVLVKQVLIAASFAVCNCFIAPYGAAALAAAGIAAKVNSFAIVVIMGITQGFLPLAAFSFGAKNTVRVLGAIKSAMAAELAWAVLCAVLYAALGARFVSLFSTDAAVIAIGKTAMQAFAWCIVFNAASYLIESLYLAAGKAMLSFVFSVSRFLLLLPVIILATRQCGLDGAVYSMPAADVVFCVALALPLFAIFLRKIKRTEGNMSQAVVAQPINSHSR